MTTTAASTLKPTETCLRIATTRRAIEATVKTLREERQVLALTRAAAKPDTFLADAIDASLDDLDATIQRLGVEVAYLQDAETTRPPDEPQPPHSDTLSLGNALQEVDTMTTADVTPERDTGGITLTADLLEEIIDQLDEAALTYPLLREQHLEAARAAYGAWKTSVERSEADRYKLLQRAAVRLRDRLTRLRA